MSHDEYTCKGKGGRYRLLGLATGAGLSRGEDRLVYQDIRTHGLFLRTEADFAERMQIQPTWGHGDTSWQGFYGGPNEGQQYRCILCGAGGASARGSDKPLTYHCHECPGKSTMWPTPQYALYRAQVLKEEVSLKAFAAELKQLCKDFSDLQNRPYMGDVTSAIDGLLENFLAADKQNTPL